MAATTEEVPRPYGRGTSSVVSFVVAMNRVDVVDLVVDLVDVNLDIDLVDVDLDVDLVDVDLERAIDKKEIKTRAPDVRLTHRLVHSASFFKTKRSSILPRLKTKQIRQFCNVKKIM